MNKSQASAKEYLSQVYLIDTRINSKLEQAMRIREQATKATSMITDMPRPDSRNTHPMESIVVKLIGLEDEINADIDRLVDLKQEIMNVISKVERPEYKALLEHRYLCFKTWDYIAKAMWYSIQNVHCIHHKALSVVASMRGD